MKKSLFIALFLVLSSFFFISVKEVEAVEYNFNFSFDYLPEDFTEKKEIVDNFIKEDTSLSDNYIIYLAITGIEKQYYVIFLDNPNSLKITYSSNSLTTSFTSSYTYKKFSSDNFLGNNVNSSYSFKLFENGIYQNYFLYSNFDILTNNDNHTISFISDNYSKTFQLNGYDKFPTIYDMYLEKNNILPENLHKEEMINISNFYTICINKLVYLGEQITSNYIYLSMVVVLILIFIIELIRRWLL